MSPTRRLNNPRVILGGAALLAVLAAAGLHGHHGAQAKDKPAAASVAVDAAPAARVDVPVTLEGLGTVQAFYTVKITPRVDGQLDRVAFTEGQALKKGQLLAQIDPRPYQAALDQSLAQRAKDAALLGNAKADLARYVALAPQDLASKQTVDTQRAAVAQAEAQVKVDDASVENARTQLSYTTITAPIDGSTGIRNVDPGNIVHASDTAGIVVMTQLQPISVVFTLPEDALPRMSDALEHGTVSVEAVARGGTEVLDTGVVSLIDNQIDQSTGTVRVKATFPNPHHRLWPGQFVIARSLLHVRRNALTIPASALQRGPNGVYAYVIGSDATVEMRPLKVTLQGEFTVIVEGGLNEGEQVVTSNQYRLQPGAHVRINAPQDTKAASGGKNPGKTGHHAS